MILDTELRAWTCEDQSSSLSWSRPGRDSALHSRETRGLARGELCLLARWPATQYSATLLSNFTLSTEHQGDITLA